MLIAFAIVRYGNALTSTLLDCLEDEQFAECWMAVGLCRPDGTLVSEYQLNRMYGVVEEGLRSSPLRVMRQQSARKIQRPPYSARRLKRNRKLLDRLMTMLVIGWAPQTFVSGFTVAFDATFIETHARPLPKLLRQQLMSEGSRDLLLSRERNLPEQEQVAIRRQRSLRAVEAAYGHQTRTRSHPNDQVGGYALHTSVLVEKPGQPNIPRLIPVLLITAASGFSSFKMMRRCMRLLPAHLRDRLAVVADRDYNKADAAFEFFRKRHRWFVFDLRKNQRKSVRYRGMVVQGGVGLCPGIPEQAINPGSRPFGDKTKEQRDAKQAWYERIAAQRRYQLHVRSVRPHGVNVACPALGPSPRWQCHLRGLDRDSDLPVMLTAPGVAPKGTICEQRTVFLPDSVNRYRQYPFAWGNDKWDTHFSLARAGIEAIHGEAHQDDIGFINGHLMSTSFMPPIGLAAALGFGIQNLRKLRRAVETHRIDLTRIDGPQLQLFDDPSELKRWLRESANVPF